MEAELRRLQQTMMQLQSLQQEEEDAQDGAEAKIADEDDDESKFEADASAQRFGRAPVGADDALPLQAALLQLRELERQNEQLEQLREVTQRQVNASSADGDEDEDGGVGEERPEAVEAHLAVLMKQLEVRPQYLRS
jgi:hypothetical protein